MHASEEGDKNPILKNSGLTCPEGTLLLVVAVFFCDVDNRPLGSGLRPGALFSLASEQLSECSVLSWGLILPRYNFSSKMGGRKNRRKSQKIRCNAVN